jgi:hypothetical protein
MKQETQSEITKLPSNWSGGFLFRDGNLWRQMDFGVRNNKLSVLIDGVQVNADSGWFFVP